MKTIIATVLALSAAAPALADNQLALSLGVEPGQYTTAQLAILQARSGESGNEGRVFFDNTHFAPSRAIHNTVALAQFEQASEEDEGSN